MMGIWAEIYFVNIFLVVACYNIFFMNCTFALWASPVIIKLKIEKQFPLFMAQGVKYVLSKFDCITKKLFGDFGPKMRENIDFHPIYREGSTRNPLG